MSTTTVTFRVNGMHCGSCSLLIDDALEDLPGILTTNTSRKRRRTAVELDPTRTTPDQVIAAISELGYTAELSN